MKNKLLLILSCCTILNAQSSWKDGFLYTKEYQQYYDSLTTFTISKNSAGILQAKMPIDLEFRNLSDDIFWYTSDKFDSTFAKNITSDTNLAISNRWANIGIGSAIISWDNGIVTIRYDDSTKVDESVKAFFNFLKSYIEKEYYLLKKAEYEVIENGTIISGTKPKMFLRKK